MDLLAIIQRQLTFRTVTLQGVIPLSWIISNASFFVFSGGACIQLVDNIIMAHAKRVFGSVMKNVVTQEDIDAGLAFSLVRHKSEQSAEQELFQLMYT